MNVRGFTLVELLVGMAVTTILGVALARILISDSRFVGRQEAMMDARHASRAAMSIMSVELRMVGAGGLVAATPDSVTVQVPYAFGVTCNTSGTDLIASLMPPDSLMYATAVLAGMAWRNNTGVYNQVPGVTVTSSVDFAACDSDSVRVVPGGELIAIAGIPGTPPGPGQIMYLYQTITYRFATSTELPGRVGLWRRVDALAAEEMVAPFDSSAGFGCLVGSNLQVQTCPPGGGLTTVRGLELRLGGESEFDSPQTGEPERFRLATKIPFLNMVN